MDGDICMAARCSWRSVTLTSAKATGVSHSSGTILSRNGMNPDMWARRFTHLGMEFPVRIWEERIGEEERFCCAAYFGKFLAEMIAILAD